MGSLFKSEASFLIFTLQEVEAAEGILRQARLAKTRGQTAEANKLLQEAIDTAPGSAAVLEAVGDDYAERKQYKKALATYAMAMRLEPGNRGIEQKHANLVFQSKVSTMTYMSSDGFLISSADSTASGKVATILSIFAPGLGHIVMGETIKGFVILATWIAMWAWLIMRPSDWQLFMNSLAGRSPSGGYTIIFPIVIGLIVHISAIMACAARAKVTGKRVPIDRPKPPVDLPF